MLTIAGIAAAATQASSIARNAFPVDTRTTSFIASAAKKPETKLCNIVRSKVSLTRTSRSTETARMIPSVIPNDVRDPA